MMYFRGSDQGVRQLCRDAISELSPNAGDERAGGKGLSLRSENLVSVGELYRMIFELTPLFGVFQAQEFLQMKNLMPAI
jgi:hypothetical protein